MDISHFSVKDLRKRYGHINIPYSLNIAELSASMLRSKNISIVVVLCHTEDEIQGFVHSRLPFANKLQLP